MTPSLSGSAGASDSTGLVQPQGEFGKCSCDKQLCVEGEGCACHILILQTLCIGRYNKRPNLPNLSKKNVAEDGQTECLRNIIFFEKEH